MAYKEPNFSTGETGVDREDMYKRMVVGRGGERDTIKNFIQLQLEVKKTGRKYQRKQRRT